MFDVLLPPLLHHPWLSTPNCSFKIKKDAILIENYILVDRLPPYAFLATLYLIYTWQDKEVARWVDHKHFRYCYSSIYSQQPH